MRKVVFKKHMKCLLVPKVFSHLWLTIIPGAVGYHGSTNLDSILKSRDIALPTNVYLVNAMVFPVVMHGCESWTIKLSGKELMLLNCGVGEDS